MAAATRIASTWGFSQAGVFSSRCFLKPVFSIVSVANNLFFPAAVLLLILLVGCGQKKDAEAPNFVFRLSTQPDIRFPSVFYDSANGTKKTHRIEILNDTDEPVEFKEIRKSCACVLMSIPTGQIRPGESASLDIEMDFANKVGARTVSLLFKFKDREPARCLVHTEAYPTFVVQGGDRRIIGEIGRDAPATVEFKVETYASTESDLLHVKSLKGNNGHVVFESNPMSQKASNKNGVHTAVTNVSVLVSPTLINGIHESKMELVLASTKGESKRVPVDLFWRERGILTATPTRIFVHQRHGHGNATAAKITRSIQVRSADSRPFSIDGVDCDSSAVEVVMDETRRAEHEVVFLIDTGKIDKLAWTSVEIKASDGLGSVSIPLAFYLPVDGDSQ